MDSRQPAFKNFGAMPAKLAVGILVANTREPPSFRTTSATARPAVALPAASLNGLTGFGFSECGRLPPCDFLFERDQLT
jgi:hypothetical protein